MKIPNTFFLVFFLSFVWHLAQNGKQSMQVVEWYRPTKLNKQELVFSSSSSFLWGIFIVLVEWFSTSQAEPSRATDGGGMLLRRQSHQIHLRCYLFVCLANHSFSYKKRGDLLAKRKQNGKFGRFFKSRKPSYLSSWGRGALSLFNWRI